jgi:hypothetical protein
MRFMLFMLPSGEAYEPGHTPSAEAVSRMMAYNQSLLDAGIVLGLEGLHAPAEGARVAFEGGKARVIPGPEIKAKDPVGGFWIIKVDSQEEAIKWASQCPAEDGNFIEVREIFEMGDMPQDVRAAGADFEKNFTDAQNS